MLKGDLLLTFALPNECCARVSVTMSPHFYLSLSFQLCMFVALCVHVQCFGKSHWLSSQDGHICGPCLQAMLTLRVLRSGCRFELAAFTMAPIISFGICRWDRSGSLHSWVFHPVFL